MFQDEKKYLARFKKNVGIALLIGIEHRRTNFRFNN